MPVWKADPWADGVVEPGDGGHPIQAGSQGDQAIGHVGAIRGVPVDAERGLAAIHPGWKQPVAPASEDSGEERGDGGPPSSLRAKGGIETEASSVSRSIELRPRQTPRTPQNCSTSLAPLQM